MREITERFYVDAAGNYLGPFIGTWVALPVPEPPDPLPEDWEPPEPEYEERWPDIPAGAVEVPTAPEHASQIWVFDAKTWSPPPLRTYQISKTTPWLRMTDEEAEKMEAAMAASPARLRQLYGAAMVLDSSTELWAYLFNMLTSAFGKKRASTLLSPESSS